MKKRVIAVALFVSVIALIVTALVRDKDEVDFSSLTPRPLILDRALTSDDEYRKYGDAEGTPRCHKCGNEMTQDPEGSLMMNGIQLMTRPVSIFIYPGKWSCSCGYGKN